MLRFADNVAWKREKSDAKNLSNATRTQIAAAPLLITIDHL